MSVRSISLFGRLDDDRQSAEPSLLVYAALGHLGLFAEARMRPPPPPPPKKEKKKKKKEEKGGGGGENNVYYNVDKLSPVSTAAVFTRVHCD